MPAYDLEVSPDVLGTISLNHQWREVIVAALEAYFARDRSENSLDNQDILSAIIEDLYG